MAAWKKHTPEQVVRKLATADRFSLGGLCRPTTRGFYDCTRGRCPESHERIMDN